MSGRPWMPLYVGNYLADTQHLTAEQHGAYMLLLMHHWQCGKLPGEDSQLCRIARVHPPHWPRVKKVLGHFFDVQDDGSWTQKRVVQEITKAAEISSKRKAAALQKHSKSKASAEHLHTQSQSQSQSQESKEESTLPLRGESDVSHAISDDWPKDFREQFWEAYPRKVGRKAAYAKLKTIRSNGEVTFAKLIAAVRTIRAGEPRFIPHPTTWLNRGGWDDETTVGGFNGPAGSRPLQDDSRSISRAAGRLAEQAERGQFSFGPRPRLVPAEDPDPVRLLPKG